MIKPGQIWRDTYGDKKMIKRHGDAAVLNKRTVRVIEQEADGRWLIELVTDSSGRPPRSTPRKTRVAEKTFQAGYELQSDPA